MPDTSFLLPQRKKLSLEISPRSDGGLRARNPATGAVEFGIAWADVQHAVCVPVPEKAQRQYAFCVFPAPRGDGVGSASDGTAAAEPMVWTVPDTVPKNVSLGRDGQDGEGARNGGYKDHVLRLLNGAGVEAAGRKVVEPEEREFASTLVHAHRKGEMAFHVGAFRGSKDGMSEPPFPPSPPPKFADCDGPTYFMRSLPSRGPAKPLDVFWGVLTPSHVCLLM